MSGNSKLEAGSCVLVFQGGSRRVKKGQGGSKRVKQHEEESKLEVGSWKQEAAS